jgi:plastocyanin
LSSRGTPIVGVIVAILIVGAVASIGYYQFEVAPSQVGSSTTASVSSVACTPITCKHVIMVTGAGSQPSNYSTGTFSNYGYSPDIVTLVIGVNNTVIFTNNDTTGAIHTATDPGVFESGCLGENCPSGPASSYQFTFTTAGTYKYSCSYHPWMQGEVVVKGG